MFRFINQMAHKSHKELLTSGLSPAPGIFSHDLRTWVTVTRTNEYLTWFWSDREKNIYEEHRCLRTRITFNTLQGYSGGVEKIFQQEETTKSGFLPRLV